MNNTESLVTGCAFEGLNSHVAGNSLNTLCLMALSTAEEAAAFHLLNS